MLFVTAALVLQLELVRHSLAGTHYRYRQYIDDRPVVGGEVNVTVRPDGSVEEARDVAVEDRRPRLSGQAGLPVLHIVNVHGVAHSAHRVETNGIARYIDDETGEVIRIEPRFAGAKAARVFDANPVKTLNDPSLQDQDNSATAVPDAAYSIVDLEDLNPSGPLGGPYCQITDLQPPSIAPVDSSSSLIFDRSQTAFEDVNAYFQVDRSQRYLQSLGYNGNRGIAQYPLPVDTHAANGADTSFFIPSVEIGKGSLIFGDGGTDDAEDPDLVVHEYAHAVHEWIAPGTFLGPFASEGRAISEGFADYWGFSASYGVALHSGRDPFCFADWDARCWQDSSSEQCGYPVGADCLRRLDSAKTIADFDHNENNGTQYLNGEIWSSALREIFVALTQRYGVVAGRRAADTIVVESLFGAPPDPGFAGIARKMIAADHYLNNGANADVICAAMTHRGILTDCGALPRGELTVFQSGDRGIAIPDNDQTGITVSTFVSDSRAIEKLFVQVDIAHPVRGDLEISLVAPDGTVVNLQNQSNDRTADVHATFGRDSVPVDSLDVFKGRSAQGEWQLRVRDVRPRDAGILLSWSLAIQFAGDTPLATRPLSATRQFIPVVGRIPGANATFFRSDVRLLNRSSRDGIATLIFTADGADGRTDFAAVNVNVPANSVVTLDDVVGDTFGTAGLGQLEIDGDVVVASRTYTRRSDGGSMGEFIGPVAGRRSGLLLRLSSTTGFRSNIGFAETSGNGGTINLTLLDAVSGAQLQQNTYSIAAFGHLQIPANTFPDMIATFDSTTDVAAYASVVDNNTGDATYVVAASDEFQGGLAPAISRPGAFGTSWVTDVWVSGAGSLTYVDASTHQTASFPIVGPLPELHFADVLSSPFHATGSYGVLVSAATHQTAVIGNDGYRQSVSYIAPSAAAQDLPYIENSAAFRTNIGLMSDVATVVRVTLFDAAGNALDSSVHTLAPLQLDQFAIQRAVTDGHIHFDVLSGQLAAYASVVDNITGDASFVPAQ
ncbi:MAG TPA: proprotein convertase P-domain-containing protein [Thermoanaerobaculia bacterium]